MLALALDMACGSAGVLLVALVCAHVGARFDGVAGERGCGVGGSPFAITALRSSSPNECTDPGPGSVEEVGETTMTASKLNRSPTSLQPFAAQTSTDLFRLLPQIRTSSRSTEHPSEEAESPQGRRPEQVNTQQPASKPAPKRARGEKHGRARLTEAQVQHVRDMAALGFSQRTIARHAGIKSQATVSDIVSRKLWAHLPDRPQCALVPRDINEVEALMQRQGGHFAAANGLVYFSPPAAADDVDLDRASLNDPDPPEDVVTPAAVDASIKDEV